MVWTTRLVLVVLLLGVSAAAQELSTKADASEDVTPASPAPASAEPIKSALPDKPAPQGNFVTRPFYDKQIRLLAEINGGAAVWDDVASRLVIERGGYERNPFMRPFVHNTGTLVVESVVEVWAMAYVGNWMKHSSHPILRKTWWLPQSLNIAAKTTGGIYNSVLLNR